MERQKIFFWLIIITFSITVSSYVFLELAKSRSKVVNFAKEVENFRIRGVPDFSLPQFAPNSGVQAPLLVKLSNVRAPVTLINFWASWCEPCTKEFPSLIALARKFSGDPRFVIIAVSVDSDMDRLRIFFEEFSSLPPNFLNLVDISGEIAKKFGTRKIPETYIINGAGKLLRKVISEQNWNSHDLEMLLLSFLEKAG